MSSSVSSRTRLAATAATGVAALLLAGCGSTSTGSGGSDASPGASGQHASGQRSSGQDMDASMDMGGAQRPSDAASMICGPEIEAAVKRTFQTSTQPAGTSSWSPKDRLFSCAWQVPGATVDMSVQDALSEQPGRAYFDRLRSGLPGVTAIKGLEGFGFPAFSTSSGNVVFLKDGKTLRVDATSVPRSALPTGFGREDVAYSIAAAVIACWSE